jgi:hypothetical protein
LTVSAINGNKVTKVVSITVGALPAGIACGAHGHLCAGNLIDGDPSVLRAAVANVTTRGGG